MFVSEARPKRNILSRWRLTADAPELAVSGLERACLGLAALAARCIINFTGEGIAGDTGSLRLARLRFAEVAEVAVALRLSTLGIGAPIDGAPLGLS